MRKVKVKNVLESHKPTGSRSELFYKARNLP